MTKRIAMVCALAAMACGAPAGTARADGQATFGTQWWTQSAPEARFRELRDVPQGPFLESFFFQDTARGLGYSLAGANVVRRDQSERLRAWQGARAWLALEYQQIPHRFSQVASTAFGETAPGVLRLPDSLQAFLQRTPTAYVPTMRNALESGHRVALALSTDVGRARAGLRPARGLTFEVRGERRLRSGTRAYGGPFGFNSTFELPERIDQRMLDADAILGYVRNALSLQVTGGFDAFQNRLQSLVWDNPKTLFDVTGGSTSAGTGTSQGRLAQEPTNHVVRGQVALGVRLPRRATFTGTVGLSRQTQDQAFLPMTINSAILSTYGLTRLDSMPARSLDGKADVLTQDYRLTGRVVPKLLGTLRYHQHFYDNRTRVITWPAEVILDESYAEPDSLNPLQNAPYSNRQSTGGLDLVLDVTRMLSLNGTAEVTRRTRTHREVARDDEAVFELGATVRPLDVVTLQASWHHGKRTLDHFDLADYSELAVDSAGAVVPELLEQPTLRRFDVANRRRDIANGSVGWSLGERADLSVQYGYARDRYPDSGFGLQDAFERSVVAQATVHLLASTDATGGYGWRRLDSRQRSQAVTSSGVVVTLADSAWTATLKDRNAFAFARVEWGGPGSVVVSADYLYDQDRTFFDLRGTQNVAGTAPRFAAVDLPPILYRHHTAILEARYRLRTDSDLAVRYGYDQYTIHDFGSQNIPLLAVAALSPSQTAVYLGNNAFSYRAHQVAVVATRRF